MFRLFLLLAFLLTSFSADAVIVSRLALDHPALGASGGSSLHTQINNIYVKIGDNMATRYEEILDLANGAITSDIDHNFQLPLGDIKVVLYSLNEGTGELTRLTSATTPTAANFTVSAGTDSTDQIKITNNSGLEQDIAVLILQSIGDTIGDFDDVDITSTAPEDGQALVFDSTAGISGTGAFIPGASGDSSFKIQSVTDPTAQLKGGDIGITDGRQLATYDGTGSASTDFRTDLSCNLDTILGGDPVNSTTYVLYIDINLVSVTPTTTTDTGEELFQVVCADMVLKTTFPEDDLKQRFIHLGFVRSADAGTVWSGAGAAFGDFSFRSHGRPVVNTSPVIFEQSNTITVFGGTTGTITHNKNIAALNQVWSATATDNSTGDQLELSPGDFITNKSADVLTYDFTSIPAAEGADTVTVRLQNFSASSNVLPIHTFDTGFLSAAPGFPLAHGLGVVPGDYDVQHEQQAPAGAGEFTDVSTSCFVSLTDIDCSGLATVDATHRLRIIVSANNIASSIGVADATNSGIVSTVAQTIAGAKTFNDNLKVDTATLEVENTRSLTMSANATQGVLTAGKSGSSADLLLRAHDGGSPTSGITIDSAGEVGVNITTPSGILHVGGLGTVGTPSLAFGVDGDSVFINTPSLNVMQFGLNNLEKMRLHSNDNLGINDTNPQDRLSVGGSISATPSVKVTNTSTLLLSADGSGGIVSGGESGDNVTLLLRATTGAGFTAGITIDTAGEVGINNTNPTAQLDVTGDVKISTTLDVATAFKVNGSGITELEVETGVSADCTGLSVNNICSGEYTPTPNDVDNITTGGAGQHIFTRVGNVVTVSGRVGSVDPGSGTSFFEIDLPIPSDFDDTDNLHGVCDLRDGTTGHDMQSCQLIAKIAATGEAQIRIEYNVDPGSADLRYTFQYVIE